MISAVVITKNEENNIEECLKTLSFCEEIIVVDDNSIDKTVEIAKKNHAVVYIHTLVNFSEQRNLALSKTKNEWAFFVDADERVSNSLAEEIEKRAAEDNNDGFLIKREDTFLGKKMKGGDLGNIWLMRLAKKSKGKWIGEVHESWKIEGRLSRLNNPLQHKSHKTLREFVQKINFYSTLRARELFESNKSTNLLEIIFYTKLKFINLYFLKMGFRDGFHGLVHALFMSLYSFLVRGKLYQLNKNGK